MKDANDYTKDFWFWILIIIAVILIICGLCYLFPSDSCTSSNTSEGSSTTTSPDGYSCQDPTSTGWWLIVFGVIFLILAGLRARYVKTRGMLYVEVKKNDEVVEVIGKDML